MVVWKWLSVVFILCNVVKLLVCSWLGSNRMWVMCLLLVVVLIVCIRLCICIFFGLLLDSFDIICCSGVMLYCFISCFFGLIISIELVCSFSLVWCLVNKLVISSSMMNSRLKNIVLMMISCSMFSLSLKMWRKV